MAAEIAEPSDLPPGSITDATASRYELLVYEKAADDAGIKKIGIAPWKDYLNFNSHKVDNVASYIGMPSDYPWDENADNPYSGTTLSTQVSTLSTKLGISSTPGDFSPTVIERINALQDSVDGYHTGETEPTPNTGLLTRMGAAEHDIETLASEIGSSGGASGTLTGRIETLETKVGNEASGADPATGLILNVRTLQTEVEDNTSGLIKKVDDINTILGDGATPGLRKDVTDLKATVTTNTQDISTNTANISSINTILGDGTNPGLRKSVADNTTAIGDINTEIGTPTTSGIKKDIKDLQDTVGDNMQGLVKDVANLQTTVGDNTSGLVKDVADNTGNIQTINTILNGSTPGTGLVDQFNILNNEVNTPVTGIADRVTNLETTISGVYKYSGNITGVNNPIQTTYVEIDGESKPTSALKNGEVFNINPSSGDSITINGKSYSKGTNVAWVKLNDTDPGYFDELGTVIDVTEINDLKTVVNDIKYYSFSVAANTSWTTQGSGIGNGVYQFSLTQSTGLAYNFSTFITVIYSEKSVITTPIDLSGNFSTYWEIDSSNSIKTKNTISGAYKVSYIKIGEI